MASAIPESHSDILDKKAIAHIATLMKDGAPQVTPVWVERVGETVLVNTAMGRMKDRNLRRDARVALPVTDPDNPYRGLMIRGKVTGFDDSASADAHIDALAKKYLGVDTYPYRANGERRVILTIAPERVSTI